MKNRRWLWIIPIVLVVGVGVWWAIGRSPQPPTDQTQNTGEIVAVVVGDLSASATASGQLSPKHDTTLAVTAPRRVEAVNVRVGDTVEAGQVLVQLETADLTLNLSNAQQTLRLQQAALDNLLADPDPADIAAAQANVASAQAALADLLAGPTEAEIALYEANLRISQASLSSASSQLASVRDTITQAQIQQAEAAVLSAQIQQELAAEINADNPTQATHDALQQANQTLAQAQANLDALRAGPNQTQLGQAQASVTASSARLEGSEADYALFLGGPTAAQTAQAEAQLAQAEASLADLLEPASTPEVQAAQAQLAQAEIAVAEAEAALAEAEIRAPFAGVITAVHTQPGEIASGPVIDLFDTSQLEIVLQVDEIDVGQLTVGQPAVVTLEAWPDTEIDSQITRIAPSGNSGAVVTYDVLLALGQTDLPARVGMTANADLITANFDDVLLVPNRAISADRNEGIFTVTRVTEDAEGNPQTEEVEVIIGVRDGQFTQILSGVDEGDQLLIGNQLPTFDVQGEIFGGGDDE